MDWDWHGTADARPRLGHETLPRSKFRFRYGQTPLTKQGDFPWPYVDPFLGGTQDLFVRKINSRLEQFGIESYIQVRDFKSESQGRLKFNFSLMDHDYVNAENGTPYKELSAFRGPQKPTLWIKVFMVISEVTGKPMNMIDGSEREIYFFNSDTMLPGCGQSVTMKSGSLEVTGEPCVLKNQMVAVPRPIDIQIGHAQIASGTIIPLEPRSAMSKLISISEEFFTARGAQPTTDQFSNSFVISAYAMKDAVLVGQSVWEKVSFYVSQTPHSDSSMLSLFLVSDGFYASGVEKPPTQSYTNPFEPQHYKQLEEFQNKFINFLREKMTERK